MNSCSECRALPGNFTNAGAARESGIAHVARIIQTARRLLGVLASVSLLAFTTVVPLSSQAQPCFHGGALSENVFGTNCLGQLIAGKARPGSTVFVLLRVTMNDDCAGDQTLVTNVSDSVVIPGCTNFNTGNLLSSPILLPVFGQFQNIINSNGFTYQYVLPLCASGIVSHTSLELARDTNSVTNPNGALSAGGSAQLQVLRPALCLTKRCTDGVGENGLIQWTGALTNCGNAMVSNVVVRNFHNGTNEMVLGPINLAPGQSTNFGGSYRPMNACAPAMDTLVAEGTDELMCPVSVSSSATCQLVLTPGITVNKVCLGPPPAPGGQLFFSGTVTNIGNVTLTNVTVVNNQPVANTLVFGPVVLAPGQSRTFTNSYIVPANFTSCNISDTLTARGTNICTGLPVTAMDTETCPLIHTLTIQCPTNMTVQCPTDVPPPNTNAVVATSTAGGVVVTFLGQTIQTNGCALIYTRIYRAVDACTNIAMCTNMITVRDTIPPVLVGVPTNQMYQCLSQVPPLPPVTSLDNCDTNVTVTVACTTNGTCPLIITCTWTAVDDCTNSVAATRTITVRDTIPPSLTGVPTNQNFQCLSDVPAPPVVTATDNCDTNVIVTRVSTTNGVCPLIITNTWTATDDCTNISTASQVITVRDTIPPTLVGVPTNQTFQCLNDVPTPPLVTGIDNCDTNVVVTRVSTTNGTCPITITNTWTGRDDCTNIVTAVQVITVRDTIPPVLVNVPTNRTFQCLADVPPPATLTATDNCDTNVLVTRVSTTNGICPTLVVHCWTATDDCTNTVTACQTNVVLDTIPPTLAGVPTNQTYQCLGDVPPLTAVTASDNCDTNVLVTVACTTNGICPVVITCTWTARDDCTNIAAATRTITVRDTIPPVLVGVPTNQTVQCPGDVLPPANVTATDNCDGVLPVTVTCVTNGICPTMISCTWTARDRCTNTTSATRTITIQPPPVVVTVPLTNLVVCLGEPATFCLGATNRCGLTYTWRRNGNLLPNQTNNCLTIPSVGQGDLGQYCVVATGPCNSVTNCATLTLKSSIGDFVWEDSNFNGCQDPGEPGISNAVVQLISCVTTSAIRTVVTDGSGRYLFDCVEPGDYRVRFFFPAGATNYMFTTQTNPVCSPAGDSDPNMNTGISTCFTLPPNTTDLTRDAGVFRKAAIGDFVWEDLDRNGVQDAGEPGVPNVLVKLMNCAGVVLATTNTDTAGLYLFTGLVPGNYNVMFTPPPGFGFTIQDAGGNDARDSDANLVTGMTGCYTLMSGETNLTVDAGLVPQGCPPNICEAFGAISDPTFRPEDKPPDRNQAFWMRGISTNLVFLRPTEPGQWVEDLTTGTATLTGRVRSLTNLNSGFDVVVNFSGYTSNAPPGSPLLELDPSAYIQNGGPIDPSTWYYYTSFTGTLIGFGFWQGAEIRITRYGPSFQVGAGANGKNLDWGASGWFTWTVIRQPARPFEETTGQGDINIDLNCCPSAIGDFVWEDLNSNGLQEPGEPGVTNVLVQLYDCTGTLIASTNTDATGHYLFTNKAGIYYVQFTLPNGLSFTTPNVGTDDAIDSDANTLTGRSPCVTLRPGEVNRTVDAGLVRECPAQVLGAVSDPTFRDPSKPPDRNQAIWMRSISTNLIFDVSAPGQFIERSDGTAQLTGTTRSLTNLTSGFTVDVSFSGRRTTPPAGSPLLELDPSAYIQNGGPIDPSTWYYYTSFTGTLTGYGIWQGAVIRVVRYGPAFQVGAGANGKNLNWGASGWFTFTVLEQPDRGNFPDESGQGDFNLDLIVCPTAEIGDFVWEDLDRNGRQDAGEPGVPGVTVQLRNCSGQVLAVTNTDATGHYAFTNQPGIYSVGFVLPTGFIFTAANAGSNDALDSDATNGVSHCVTLLPGEINHTIDAGLIRTCPIQVLGAISDPNYRPADKPPDRNQAIWMRVISTNLIFAASEPGQFIEFADGTAVFTGTSRSLTNMGSGFIVNVNLSGRRNTPPSGSPFFELDPSAYVANGGPIDPSTWYYYSSFSGTLTGFGIWQGAVVNIMRDGPAFQVGIGANGKNDDFGASAWFTFTVERHPNAFRFSENSGPGDFNLDFIGCPPSVLGGFVWQDNGNGIREGGEAGVPNVQVLLSYCGGANVNTNLTDGSGQYAFTNVAPGSYRITFALPGGFIFAPANAGGNDAIDSDASILDGTTSCLAVNTSETNLTVAAGLVRTAAPSLRSFAFISDRCQITFQGQPGQTYRIEGSADLVHWRTITTLRNETGVLQFTDPEAGDRCFYRLVAEP